MGLERKEIGMVAVLLFGSFLVVMSANLLTPALPTIMADMGIDATTVQWLVSGYTLVEAVVTPLSAFFLGRFKVKDLFVSGIGFYIAGCLIAVLAPAFPVLLVGRMLQAVAAGIMMPMSITLVMLVFPREKRGVANGVVSLVISFAPAIGPTVGGLVVDAIGWNALFVVMLVLGIVLLVLSLKLVYSFGEFDSYSLDVPSVALLSCGMVGLLYAISSSTSSTSVAMTVALAAIGLVLLGLFVKRQLELDDPMLKIDIMRSRRYRIDIIVVVFMQATLCGCAVILPLYVQNVLGYSATVTGLVMLPGALIGAAIGLAAGSLFDRYGVRGLSVAGVTIALAATVGLASCQMDSPIWLVALVYALLPIGMQMLTPVVNTWGVNSLDNSVIQHANALYGSVSQVAASIGTAFLTAMTALASAVAPGAGELELVYAGDHMAFLGAFILVLVAAIVVYTGARDKEGDLDYAEELAGGQAGEKLNSSGRKIWTVADVMDAGCLSIRSDQTVGDALDLIVETYTSGLPVVDDEGAVEGYLSDGDVMEYLGDNNVLIVNDPHVGAYRLVDDKGIHENLAALRRVGVMSLATEDVVSLKSTDTLEKACAVLSKRRIKKAPVVDDGKLVGMVSRRDIICYIVENVPASVQGVQEA